MTLTKHWGVTILWEENRELTLLHAVEALWYIGKELHILRLIELRLWLHTIGLLAPAKELLWAIQQELNINILAVQLQTSLALVAKIQLLDIYKDTKILSPSIS